MSRQSPRSKQREPARRVARRRPRQVAAPTSNGPAPRPTPCEFLRERRPYLFSDSSRQTRPRLDRAFLEYFISKLTSRSQEADFETFALRLCKREVCPNLLPHTGPTGGGDSKVDSETYPVSRDIADTWYVGEARTAADERWAFAFSAKADWRSKLKSDIEKMAATGRGYARYFFVTSQFVPDQMRADLEDDYRNNRALDVRILDLNWLLEKVFSGGHEELAVRSLHIDVELEPEQRLGPNDAERAAREVEYEERIAVALRSGQVGPRTVGLALESAIISRESERPRSEVEGKLERVARLAADHGFTSQQRSVAYQRAWTAYWWLEDGPAFSAFAEAAYEAQVRGTRNSFELERLANLYMCARVGIGESWQAGEEWLAERLRVLNGELDRLASVETAPSAALNARVTRLVVQLSTQPETFEETLRRLNEALDSAAGLPGFGFEPLADLIGELGTVVPQSAEFDALHERLVQEMRQRTGDVTAGEMYLQRAVQLYRAERRAEAVTAAGRALLLLSAEESRGLLLRTLDLIGECYLAIGLPWAARGSWLMAASLAGPDAEGFGRDFPRLLIVFDRLRSVELRLGRLPESLAIHRLYRLVASVAARDDASIQNDVAEADVAYESVLANALLNLDAAAAQLPKLPDFLASQNLPIARTALLYTLGHEATLPEWLGVASGGERRFLSNLRAAPGGVNLNVGVGRPGDGILEARVLGVRIEAQFEGGSPAKETAESLLAAIESLLATTAGRGFFGFVPLVVIRVRPGHFTEFPWRVVDGADGDPTEVAVAQFDPSQLTTAQQGRVHEALVEAVARIVARGFHIDTPDQTLAQLFGEEGALARASSFTGSFVSAGDLYEGLESGLDGLLSGEEVAYSPTGSSPIWDEVVRNEPPPRRAADDDPTGGPVPNGVLLTQLRPAGPMLTVKTTRLPRHLAVPPMSGRFAYTRDMPSIRVSAGRPARRLSAIGSSPMKKTHRREPRTYRDRLRIDPSVATHSRSGPHVPMPHWHSVLRSERHRRPLLVTAAVNLSQTPARYDDASSLREGPASNRTSVLARRQESDMRYRSALTCGRFRPSAWSARQLACRRLR